MGNVQQLLPVEPSIKTHDFTIMLVTTGKLSLLYCFIVALRKKISQLLFPALGKLKWCQQ